MMSRRLHVALAATVALTVGVGVAPAAQAAGGRSKSTQYAIVERATGRVLVNPDTGQPTFLPTPTKRTAGDVRSQRAAARNRPATAEERGYKERFRREAAQFQGLTYAENEVETFETATGVIAALPKDTTVNSLEISSDLAKGTVGVSADFTPSAIIASAPTNGAASWGQPKATGAVVIYVKNLGSSLTTWSVSQMEGETVASKDYFAYSRKTLGQVSHINGRVDPIVAFLYIRQYPHAGYYGNLLEWNDWSPDASMWGNCGGTTTTLGVNVYAAYLETSFQNCLWNDFGVNTSVPGELRIQVLNTAQYRGNFSTAYLAALAVKAGTAPYFDFQQRVDMDWMHSTVYAACQVVANGGYWACA
jgi:hypothetical protein